LIQEKNPLKDGGIEYKLKNQTMYEIDKQPNSDQEFCSNCECLVDKLDIRETIDGKSGCSGCVSQCNWCGNHYLNEDMFNDPYLGYVCPACNNAEDYLQASEDEIIKDALRVLFDSTTNKRVESLVIGLSIRKGYNFLAAEMKSDLK